MSRKQIFGWALRISVLLFVISGFGCGWLPGKAAPSTTFAIEPPMPLGQSEEWLPIFTDEFDAPALDSDKWVTCYWWADGGCNIASNNELEWYQPQNVTVANGTLQLTAQKQTINAANGTTYDYTSGMVTTGKITSENDVPHHFIYQYGYAEIKARVPAGQGLWPAFWLLPADHNSRPEIDVLEVQGDDTHTNHMNFHYLDETGSRISIGEEWIGEDFAAEWHVFGLDWQPDAIVWYVDGVERWRFEDERYVPNEPMYLLLNLAVGGDWPGAPDASTIFPSTYEIDYARVWRKQNTDAYLNLVADSFVDSDLGDDNFGEDATLSTDGTPVKVTLLMFDPRPLSIGAIGMATLRIHAGADSGAADRVSCWRSSAARSTNQRSPEAIRA